MKAEGSAMSLGKKHRNFWRMSMNSALFLSAPMVVLSAWCAWSAYADLDVYRRVASPERSISLDDFQLSLHDMTTAWIRNFLSSDEKSKLPSIKIHLKNAALQTLVSDHSGKGKYVDGILYRSKKNHHIKIRQRGHRHWHHLGAQRSLKLRFSKEGGERGLKAIALINEPTPLLIGNVLIADMAKEYGLLSPEPDFARLWLNGADMGVYRRQIMADEALLRRNDRYPCNLYSGDIDNDQDPMTLWVNSGAWKKSAWCNGEKKSKNDLEALLKHISSDSFHEFDEFAHHELNMERFATLDALEIAFAIGQRDWRQGHKLVHSIGYGRWEPIAWSLRGFANTPEFKPSDHPLGVRLEMVPGYVSMRNRILYRMLIGPARPAAVRESALKLFKKLLPDLLSDFHWDAYELAPDTDPFLYKMLRPMNQEKLALVFDSVMASYATRYTRLLSELQRVKIDARPCLSKRKDSRSLLITISGRTGIILDSIDLMFADGKSHPWKLEAGPYKQETGNNLMALSAPLNLLPALTLVKNPAPSSQYDPVISAPLPESYTFALEPDKSTLVSRSVLLSKPTVGFDPVRARIIGRNLATGSQMVLDVDLASKPLQTCHDSSLPSAEQVPSIKVGQRSAHPWSYPHVPFLLENSSGSELVLGPGDVHIDQTKTFSPRTKVRVQPGTTFIMAPGASLVFEGKVSIFGTEKEPIVITAATGGAYGGLVLRGPGTYGSRIQHLHIDGGSAPVLSGQGLMGTFSIMDTSNISVSNCTFENNSHGVDMLHASGVKGLKLEHVNIRGSSQDGLDLEFSQAEIHHLLISGSKDEAMDLMGSTVEIVDSVLNSSGGSAISAGEKSLVNIRGSILNQAKTCLLIKHASSGVLLSSLVRACKTGIMVKKASRYYAYGSSLQALDSTITRCERDIRSEKDYFSKRSANVHLLNIFHELVFSPSIQHIIKDLLSSDKSIGLDQAIDKLCAGAQAP